MDKDFKKREELFQRQKNTTLNRADLSLKGSIDEPIRDLVEIINNSKYYYTTSTCSGRITLTEKPLGKSNIKKGNKFHLNSHATLEYDQLHKVVRDYVEKCKSPPPHPEATDCIESKESCLWLKFEPFIMHIQCYDLSKSRHLLNIVMANGCRNSGVTFGNPDKFMLAVRSTSTMEVPIACDSKFDVNTNQLEFLCQEANERLSANFDKLTKLRDAIESSLKELL